MIEEPPRLTIKLPSRRPTEQQIAAFQQVPTGFVVDAMDGAGAMHSNIKPVDTNVANSYTAAGPALTCDNGPGDILALLATLKYIQPGDIIVSAFRAHQGCAALGDRLAGMVKNNEAAAIVTDGPIRDLSGLLAVDLPVWCSGINPNSPIATGLGRVGLPVQLGGMEVETGDMIVADRDGVVVVPFEIIDTVIVRVEQIKQLEKELDEEVENGLRLPDNIAELLESDQVRFVD